MWDQDAVTLTIKAIGEVESNLSYDAINYNDPITVGVAQWFGPRAASLLEDMAAADPTGWQDVNSSIREQVDAGQSNAFWRSRYLSPSEGTSLRPFLLDNKTVQNTVFAADIDDYVQVLQNVGFDIDASTDAAIFFCTVYHQSPQAALQIVNTTELSPTLDRFYNATLNNAIVGSYRSRQQRVRSIIESGDTTGVDDPPESPPDDPDGGGDQDTGGGRLTQDFSHISVQGDNIHLHKKDGGVVVAYPTTANRWTFGQDPNIGADPGPGPDPGAPGGSDDQAAVVQWMADREGEFIYSRGPARNDPDRTGYADCSSLTRQAYRDVMGIDIGSYTVEQWNNGERITSGVKGEYPDPALLQPGDLLFSLMGWSDRSTVDHVEMIVDSTTTIGHTGNPTNGPTFKGINEQLDWPNTQNWYVNRYITS